MGHKNDVDMTYDFTLFNACLARTNFPSHQIISLRSHFHIFLCFRVIFFQRFQFNKIHLRFYIIFMIAWIWSFSFVAFTVDIQKTKRKSSESYEQCAMTVRGEEVIMIINLFNDNFWKYNHNIWRSVSKFYQLKFHWIRWICWNVFRFRIDLMVTGSTGNEKEITKYME